MDLVLQLGWKLFSVYVVDRDVMVIASLRAGETEPSLPAAVGTQACGAPALLRCSEQSRARRSAQEPPQIQGRGAVFAGGQLCLDSVSLTRHEGSRAWVKFSSPVDGCGPGGCEQTSLFSPEMNQYVEARGTCSLVPL